MFAVDFPPSAAVGGLRTARLCRYLPALAWEPTVVTVEPGGLTASRDPATGQIRTGISLAGSSSLDRIALPSRNPIAAAGRARSRLAASGSATGQSSRARSYRSWRAPIATALRTVMVPDEYVLWALHASRVATRLSRARSFSAVWATYPSLSAQLAAALVSKRTGLPLVVDFRDDPGQWGPAANGIRFSKRTHLLVERFIMRRASAVTGVTEGVLDDTIARHAAHPSQATVLEQGWDPLEAKDLSALHRYSERDGVMRIMHAGTITPDLADPAVLLRAARTFLNEHESARGRLQIVFLGQNFVDIAALARGLGIEDVVELRPQADRQSALEQMARCDALVLIRNKPGRSWITGKIWDYLTAAIPILAIIDPHSAAAELVKRTRTGVVCAPDSVQQVASGIATMWKSFEAGGRVDYNPSAPELDRVSAEAVAQRLVDVLEQLTG